MDIFNIGIGELLELSMMHEGYRLTVVSLEKAERKDEGDVGRDACDQLNVCQSASKLWPLQVKISQGYPRVAEEHLR